jgi:hypothetical protein
MYLLSELMNLGTTKLLVAVQRMVDTTAPEENNHRSQLLQGISWRTISGR